MFAPVPAVPHIAVPLQSLYTEAELPDLVAEILDRLKSEKGMSQSDVAQDLARDGGGAVTQSAISQAKTRMGGRYVALQLRIIQRYRDVDVTVETIYRFSPRGGSS